MFTPSKRDALARYNRNRAEANKLPEPTMHGERILSPGDIPFQAVVYEWADRRWTIGWELCLRDWTLLGVTFRERELPVSN